MAYPSTPDAAQHIVAQVITAQQLKYDYRSLMLTKHDSDPDVGSPHSFAIVMYERVGIDEAIEDMHLHTDCPPIKPQNECLLWFGTYAIQPLQQVHLRHGNALQLVIRRGILVSLSDMLALTDQQLRTALPNSIWVETYRRPSYPVFPGEALHFQNPMDAIRGGQATDGPVSSRTAQPTDHRPDWIRELQEIFNAHAFTENTDEGPVLYVMTWLIHGHDRQRSN